MYPMFYGPPPMYPNQQQSPPTVSILSQMKQNQEELEAIVKFMEDRKKKDDKPKQTWKDKKYGILEIATCMIIVCFFGAIPVTTWMLSSIANLYHTMQMIFK